MADKERKSSVADTLQPADGQAEIPVVVAVHIRPLIHDEVVNGCSPCLSVTEGEPQVRSVSSAAACLGPSGVSHDLFQYFIMSAIA